MKVAVIDDGIARGKLDCPVQYWCVRDGRVIRDDGTVTPFSHGSMCVGLIVKGIREVEIICISIYSEFGDGREADLITALSWCAEHPVDYINLSNGICSGFQNEALNDVCYRLWKQGTVIVASISNSWKYTVPAHLPWVIGVSRFALFSRERRNPFVKEDQRSFGAILIPKRHNGMAVRTGNSFACARMTHRLLKKGKKKGKGFQYRISSNLPDFSLLKNVIVLGGDGIEKSLLVFPVAMGNTENACEDGMTLVMADPHGKERMHQLRELSDRVRLLVWCDTKASLQVRRWCRQHGITLWKEPRRKGQLRGSENLSDLVQDCFVVGLRSSGSTIEKAVALKKTFEEKAYRVLLFSDVPHGYLYGAVNDTAPRRILQACAALDPDLILVMIPTGVDLGCDVCLTFGSDQVLIEADETVRIPVTGNVYSRIAKEVEDMSHGETIPGPETVVNPFFQHLESRGQAVLPAPSASSKGSVSDDG